MQQRQKNGKPMLLGIAVGSGAINAKTDPVIGLGKILEKLKASTPLPRLHIDLLSAANHNLHARMLNRTSNARLRTLEQFPCWHHLDWSSPKTVISTEAQRSGETRSSARVPHVSLLRHGFAGPQPHTPSSLTACAHSPHTEIPAPAAPQTPAQSETRSPATANTCLPRSQSPSAASARSCPPAAAASSPHPRAARESYS